MLHGATAEGDIEYRLGYPMIPAADLPRLIDLAITEGTISPRDALRFQIAFAAGD